MTPGKKRVGMNEKKKNENFRVNARSGVAKGSNGSSVKKAKSKTVPKKKLKNQTKKWIEDVNKTFDDLQSKLADEKMAEKLTNQKETKVHKEEERRKNIKSDVSDAEVSSTIANMANLLEQT